MRVWPTSDAMRQALVHPTAGKFHDTGGAEWPEDSFTHRRIRDGDVSTEEPKEDRPKAKPAPQKTE